MAGSADGSGRAALTRPTLAGGEAYASDIPPQKGGGSSPPPQSWFEAQARLAPQVGVLRRQAASLTQQQLGRDRKVIIEAETMPNFLAASHYPDKLFGALGVTPVGSRPATGTRVTRTQDIPDQPAKTFLLAADETSLGRLEAVFAGPSRPEEPVEVDARKLTSIRLEGPDQVLRPGTGEVPPMVEGRMAFEAVLHPQLAARGEPDPAAERRVHEDFIAYVKALGGLVNTDFGRQEGGMWHLPILLPQVAGIAGEVARFAQLRVLRPMPRMRVDPNPGELRWQLAQVPGAPPAGSRRIAVFDGGVDRSIPGLQAWVSEIDLTGQHALSAHRDHGTAVTSAALLGNLDPALPLPRPHTGIDHYRVWPPPPAVRADAELSWVLAQIEQVISTGSYRIAVISLAPQLTVDDAEPHAWTATLDRLALDHDVLFVVAAGNNGELEPGLDRLLVPGDLINGLSVGACTERHGLAVRDSYSCVGPGRPGGATAPTGVQFGGNLDQEAFGALISGGDVAAHEGTSLAAPLVARGCAELDALLQGRTSANLLRTMAVHHAERPNPKKEGQREGSTSRDVGYGRLPETYRQHLEHDSRSVTIVYQGHVKRRQRVALDIPVPDDVFASAPTKRFDLRWTLGFFAPVEPSNPVDYSVAGIQVTFRPHTQRFNLYDADGNPKGTIDLLTEQARWAYEQSQGTKLADDPRSSEKTGVAPEVVRRQVQGKWEGVVRMDRTMQGRALYRPRLDFHMLVREGGDLLREADDLNYVLAVSVTAQSPINVYDRTRAHATLLNPLTVSVPVMVDER
jgi:hypothetical protein